MRTGGLRAGGAAPRAGRSDSSQGSAIAAPAPRRKRRRFRGESGVMVGSLLHVAVPERVARHDALGQDAGAVAFRLQGLQTLVDDALVLPVQLPAQGVAEQLARQGAEEVALAVQQDLLQFR